MKRSICILLIVALLVPCLACRASAAVKDEIELQFETINTIHARLTIDETLGIATCYGRITAKNTYPVEVELLLQVYKDNKWVTLKTWSNTGTMNCSTSHQYAIARGYTYCVYVTGYVYDSNGAIIEAASASHIVEF